MWIGKTVGVCTVHFNSVLFMGNRLAARSTAQSFFRFALQRLVFVAQNVFIGTVT